MEQTAQSGDSVSQLALQVALQTMKERCIALQKRLNLVEEENQQLREHGCSTTSPTGNTHGTSGGAAENFQLRLQLADLQRQKAQLSEHINMVSNENRKLWSRLSQMAKEQGKSVGQRAGHDCAQAAEEEQDTALASPRSGGVSANQNLIRSKTFTQHSPNPNLRHKVISSDVAASDEISADISLEEVALSAFSEDTRGAVIEYAEDAEAELGFAYLNVTDENAATNDPDFSAEAKRCIEGLQEMRREAMKQQQELNVAMAAIENRIAMQPCPECAKKSQKPEMADKSLETDDSLSEIKFDKSRAYNSQSQVQQQQQQPQPLNSHSYAQSTEPVLPKPHLNIIQEKVAADEVDKTCPMCGRVYTSAVTFDAFREHVEMHFVDDSLSDIEASVERNFELVSHAVGDF